MDDRYTRIKNFLKNYTRSIIEKGDLSKNSGLDATGIAIDLNIERANASRILNELWRNGEVIKIQGRPTLYLDFDIIKNEYPNTYIPTLISKNTDLLNYIGIVRKPSLKLATNQKSPLDNIVGANGTMRPEIDRFISALSYPPCGLPVILCGKNGSGKRKFIEAIFDYAKYKKIKNEKASIIFINCQEYAQDHELFLKRVFGRRNKENGKNEQSAIDEADGGIVCFDNIERLSIRSINLVLDLITSQSYTRLGDNRLKKIDVTFVITTSLDMDGEIYKMLSEHIPSTIKLPLFDKRNIYEKIETVLYMFLNEASNIKKNIVINRSVITALLSCSYPGNEAQLRNEIKSSCADAYKEQINNNDEQNALYIELNNLSNYILSSKSDLKTGDIEYIIRTLDTFTDSSIICERNGTSKALDYFRSAITSYTFKNLRQFAEQFKVNINTIGNDRFQIIKQMIETLMTCDVDYVNELYNNINPIVFSSFNKCLSNSELNILLENKRLLYGLLVALSFTIKNIGIDIDNSNNIIKDNYKNEYDLAVAVTKNIENQIKRQATRKEIEFIALYFYLGKSYLSQAYISILIVMHGDNIATDLYNLVNKYASEKGVAIEAINYNSKIQLNDIMELSANAATRLNKGSGVIIMTDVEPLVGIKNYIVEKDKLNCEVIADTTLRSLLFCIDNCANGFSMKHIKTIGDQTKHYAFSDDDDFVSHLVNDVLAKTLLYVNPKRASDCLVESLKNILEDLNIQYSQEILVKFLSHGLNMVERIIRKDYLPYYHLKKFTNENYRLMDIISDNLDNVRNTFDIVIPNDEIAYLAEIFMEFIS